MTARDLAIFALGCLCGWVLTSLRHRVREAERAYGAMRERYRVREEQEREEPDQ